MAYDANDLVIK
jgi:hypothetical protein